jgi:hypothetical protein
MSFDLATWKEATADRLSALGRWLKRRGQTDAPFLLYGALCGASQRDRLGVGLELLSQHTDLDVLGDKEYISAPKAAELWQGNRLRLQSLPRRNQKRYRYCAHRSVTGYCR